MSKSTEFGQKTQGILGVNNSQSKILHMFHLNIIIEWTILLKAALVDMDLLYKII
jgi:hypothetical protein